ncbi:hypothetical protein [Bacillus sp. V33-4]|uniref:hypothetical protein n=1 Tax=Bacillus sp. V33-4 TaxID=2054169 RepID=UPI000C76527D|nr:hypothetical protein [Bacillus sp. V33-4]PLR85282.1 hypothetical protein CVD23_10055 [Bacillus sp. V33-4]
MIVRMRGLFGQDEREKSNDSPNARVIRTRQAGNWHMIVRMRGLFGQDKQEISNDSLNEWVIRTILCTLWLGTTR